MVLGVVVWFWVWFSGVFGLMGRFLFGHFVMGNVGFGGFERIGD